MKKTILFLTAALLVAFACTREPVISEKPDTVEKGPIKVSLVAGNPGTRTELGYHEGVLMPFWTNGDGISIHETTDANTPFYREPVNFTGILQDDGFGARFEGDVDYTGSYIAFYPQQQWVSGDWSTWKILSFSSMSWTDGKTYGMVKFKIPSVQYPSLTSFDPLADFMVSDPFQIGTVEADANEVVSTNDIPIYFTRMNAIVKIVLQDPAGRFDGQHVKSVTLSTTDPNADDDEDRSMGAQTRATAYDNNWSSHGLAGEVYYLYPMTGQDAYHVEGASYQSVTAVYNDETYTIGEEGAATYLITVPSILRNREIYDDESGDVVFRDGLYVHVETDRYIIDRHIVLPEDGLGLQPSRVTTLNINLNKAGTVAHERTIEFDQSDYYVFTPESTNEENDYLAYTYPCLVSSDGFVFSREDFANATFTLSDASKVDLFYDYDADANWIEDDYASFEVRGKSLGDTQLTVNYMGMTASCTIHVIDWDSPLVQPIEFEDETVKSICFDLVSEFFDDDLLFDGSITPLEASYLPGFGEVFVNNTDITSFKELRYFTGLKDLDYAFSGCTSLRYVELPPTLTGNLDRTFYNCSSLVSVGDLPEGLTGICLQTFYNCQNLTSISLPASLTMIETSAFADCRNLTSVTIPGGVEVISSNAFANCINLSNVQLSNGLKRIERAAFYLCNSLHEITFPSTLEYVYTNAFAGVKFMSGDDGENSYNGITFLGEIPPTINDRDDNHDTFWGEHWAPDLNNGAGMWTRGVQIRVPAASLDLYSQLNALKDGNNNTIVGF